MPYLTFYHQKFNIQNHIITKLTFVKFCHILVFTHSISYGIIKEKTKEEINMVVNEVKNEEKVSKPEKKPFQIAGFTIWRLLAYFIVYSFLGFVIETLYGMITKGVIESRQSFLYGPFCGIYGLGAIVMIVSLQFFNKNNNHLFIGGFIIGSITEYFVSLIGELILHVKWWDYSSMPFNIGGRVCIFFSIFWGLLGIYLVSYINPKIDRIINWFSTKISMKKLRIATTFMILFLIFDCTVTVYALDMFFIRKVYENDLRVANFEEIEQRYQKIYTNENKKSFINQYFGDKKIIRTFPNLKMKDIDGNIIYFDTFAYDITPYYYRLHSNLKGILEKRGFAPFS